MLHWYVVRCQANAERRARDNLVRQEFRVWLPLCRKTRRHARRTESVLRPLFPRYLFLAADFAEVPWRPILSTYGVSGLLSGPDGPAPVPEGVIEALQARADSEGIVALSTEAFRTGERVRVVHGPLAELEGIFQTRTDSERIQLLLTLMGHAVRVIVRSDDIERA